MRKIRNREYERRIKEGLKETIKRVCVFSLTPQIKSHSRTTLWISLEPCTAGGCPPPVKTGALLDHASLLFAGFFLIQLKH